MSGPIFSGRLVEYITDFASGASFGGNPKSGKNANKIPAHKKTRSLPSDISRNNRSQEVLREQMRQLRLDIEQMHATVSERLDRQEREMDETMAMITEMKGQLEVMEDQNSGREDYLAKIWKHVVELNEWARKAREKINGQSLQAAGDRGPVDA